MRLIRIKLVNWRGVGNAEIHLADGVTVVEGANEAGKSSFIEALNLLFRERDSTKKQEVKRIIPKGVDAGNTVEVELVAGDYHITYTKTFNKKTATTLFAHAPEKIQLAGVEAHERAQEILNDAIDFGLWQAIQLEQGNDFTQVNLKSSNSLAQALDAAAGGTGVGEGEAILLDKVKAEYLRYYTQKHGKETGELLRARERLNVVDAQVADISQQLASMERQIERSAQIARQLRCATEAIPRLQSSLQEQEQKQAQLLTRRDQLARARLQVQTQQHTVDKLQQQVVQRQKLSDQLSERSSEIETGKQQLLELEKARVAADAVLQKATSDSESLLAERSHAERSLRRIESDIQLRDKLREKEQLQTTLSRAVTAYEERDHINAALAKLMVDDKSIALIEALEQQRIEQQVRIKAQAPALTITALQNTELLMDGDRCTLEKTHTRTLDTSNRILLQIDEIATLELTPASDVGDMHQQLDMVEEKLAATLRQCEVQSVAEARSTFRERADLLEGSRLIERRCLELVEGATPETIRQRLATLEHKISRLREQTDRGEGESVDTTSHPEDKTEMPSQGTLHAGLEQLQLRWRNQLADSDLALDRVRGARDEAQQNRSAAATRLELARQRGNDSEVAFQNIEGQLQELRNKLDDRVLGDNHSREEKLLEQSVLAASQLESSMDDDGVERVDQLVHNARQVLERARAEVHEFDKEQAAVRGSLEQLQPEGLHEKLELLRAGQEDARARLAQLERAADAANRLWKTLCRHQQAAQSSYARPLAERVTRMGKLVFGADFAVQLSESLTIESRTLNNATVPFADLSGGAREQLGIMLRLAAAQLVSGEEGMPLILDDTLGHTDPDRLATMGALLSSAGRHAQIVVLTCYPQRYQHVGEATIVKLAPQPISALPLPPVTEQRTAEPV